MHGHFSDYQGIDNDDIHDNDGARGGGEGGRDNDNGAASGDARDDGAADAQTGWLQPTATDQE